MVAKDWMKTEMSIKTETQASEKRSTRSLTAERRQDERKAGETGTLKEDQGDRKDRGASNLKMTSKRKKNVKHDESKTDKMSTRKSTVEMKKDGQKTVEGGKMKPSENCRKEREDEEKEKRSNVTEKRDTKTEEKMSTRGSTAEKKSADLKKDEQRTEKDKKTKENKQKVEDKEKNEGTKEKKDEDGKRDETRQEKDERKIIGKIVKASGGTKIHVKTMMGGAAEEEKRTSEGENRGDTEEKERKSKKDSETEDKTDRRKEEEGRKNKVEDTTDGKKEKKEKTDIEKRTRGQRKRHKEETHTKEEKPSGRPERGQKSSKETRSNTVKVDMSTGDGSTPREVEEKTEQEVRPETEPVEKKNTSLTDSTLHRIHGDIRIALKTGTPDIRKCLAALDQLSMLYVTSQHVQNHSELVSTLRKMRYYRASQAIMDKASMLYNRFKNAFLVGEGQEVVSAAFLRSLLEEKEREQEEQQATQPDSS
uniref:Si:ch211-116m6.3 n=2 Tax=Nothobranchius korthausae TaxID=1143690 RepID=A0A1A8G5B9_9TELE